jgi:hypothetical protein
MAAVVFLAAVALGGPDPAPVILARLCDGSPALDSVLVEIERALAERGWTTQRVPTEPERPCRDRREALTSLIGQAKDEFHRLKLAKARKLFFTALGELEISRGEPDARLRDTLVHLAWLDLEENDEASALEHFKAVLRLWPDWRPSETDYPPKLFNSFKRAVEAMRRERTGSLAVSTEPAGATVLLDGHRRCQSPCRFDDVFAGEHVVSAESPALARVVRRVGVEPGREAQVSLALVPDLRERWAEGVARRDADDLGEALRGLGSERVVLVTAGTGGEPERAVVLAPSLAVPAANESRAVVLIGTGVALVELGGIGGRVAAERVTGLLGGAATALGPGGTDSPGVVGEWWFWSSIAAAAVVTAVGVGLGYYFWRSTDTVRIEVLP